MADTAHAAAGPPVPGFTAPVATMETSTTTAQPPAYRYSAPWPVYALAWSSHGSQSSIGGARLALGSFVEEYRNMLQVVEVGGADSAAMTVVAEEKHSYPITKVQWVPRKNGTSLAGPDILATTGDFCRLWEYHSDIADGEHAPSKLRQAAMLKNTKANDYCAPITSFDWNDTDVNLLGSCSIDTTCTMWDLQTQQVRTQLIAHDREVYDMSFTAGVDNFASVGADGSVRLFDLRNLDHSTIVYETPDGAPLLRLAWNKQDPNYLATIQMDSSKVVILDIRVPSVPCCELQGHAGAVNACSWAPQSRSHLCTVGDDAQALVWDLSQMKKLQQEPLLTYTAASEINQLSWSRTHGDWIAIAHGNVVEALKI